MGEACNMHGEMRKKKFLSDNLRRIALLEDDIKIRERGCEGID
jgi:GR25 family glycosyltransferase involved in LPS biosynthesis